MIILTILLVKTPTIKNIQLLFECNRVVVVITEKINFYSHNYYGILKVQQNNIMLHKQQHLTNIRCITYLL